MANPFSFLLPFLQLNEVLCNPENDQWGSGKNLLFYLCKPRSRVNSFDFDKCYWELMNRVDDHEMSHLGFAPQDTTIYVARFRLLAKNNRAYRIAMKDDPSAEDLEEFSYIKPCWAMLWPVKCFLFHHFEEAKRYRGFLPFGSEVISFMNEFGHEMDQSMKEQTPYMVSQNPTYMDHVRLRDVSNRLADVIGVPSVVVNNLMYQYSSFSK